MMGIPPWIKRTLRFYSVAVADPIELLDAITVAPFWPFLFRKATVSLRNARYRGNDADPFGYRCRSHWRARPYGAPGRPDENRPKA